MIKPYIIGIGGGSGSGKTTFLRALFEAFEPGEIALVSQDNYYFPIEKQQKDENGWVNFDLPTSIDRKHFLEDIQALSQGQSIQKTEYTFNNEQQEAKLIEVPPAPIIITEGLFVFHYNEINQILDYRVYFDAEEGERLKRRIIRDNEERGYPEREVRYQWTHHVIPAEIEYLRPYKDKVDLLIDNTHSFQDELVQLIAHIKTLL